MPTIKQTIEKSEQIILQTDSFSMKLQKFLLAKIFFKNMSERIC